MHLEGMVYQQEAGIGTLILNRPQQLNVMTMAMLDSLAPTLQEIAADEQTKALIITGTGRGFCAGADFSALEKLSLMPLETLKEHMRLLALAFRNFPKPLIAAINGVTAGAGLGLALLCDMRIGSDKARFVAGYFRMGLVPDLGVTYLLPRIIGAPKAAELLLTGDSFDAPEAYRIGLLNKLVIEPELMKSALDLAGKIARGPTIAIRLTRQALRASATNTLEAQIDLEAAGFFSCLKTEDHREALQSFLEKRMPNFK